MLQVNGHLMDGMGFQVSAGDATSFFALKNTTTFHLLKNILYIFPCWF